jgi:hypothetical protein
MSMTPNPRLIFWAGIDALRYAIGLSPIFIQAVGKTDEFAFLNTPTSFKGMSCRECLKDPF